MMPATNVRTALAEQRQSQQQQQQNRSWLAILKASATEWMDADAMTWAAAIACYTVLALAPLLVVAVKVATIVLRQSNAIKNIRDAAGNWIGPDGATAIGAILDKMASQRSGTLAAIISGVLVVVSVGGVFAEVQQAMNRVWKLKPKPGGALMGFLRARLKSIVVLGFAALVVLASVVAVAWIKNLNNTSGTAGTVIHWVIEFVATIIVMTIIFGMVFKVVPDAQIGWRSTLWGAVMTAVLFALGKYGLAMYFKYAAPTSAFGAVGSLAAILIWIYYSAQIALFGAVFTQVFSKARGYGVRPSKHAQFLKECDETETATPSQEAPGNKPERPTPRRQPGLARGRAPADPGYAAVLGQYVPSTHAQAQFPLDAEAGQEQAVVRNLIVAGAGVAFGALLGGYGAMQMRRPKAPPAKQIAQARLQRRLDTVAEKVAHASRIKQFLGREDANDRLDEIRQRIRDSRSRAKAGSARLRRPRPEPWTAKLAETVKSFL